MNLHMQFQCRRSLVIAGCVAFSVVALLLWGRLKLVAGVPRQALADPEAVQKAQASPAPRTAVPAGRPDLAGD
jgi:hypothetical protein